MSQFIEMFGNQNTNDKGWTESLVKDEFKLSMGKTPARNNPECWDNGTHKWVSISDMSSYTRYTGDTSEYITDYAIADSGIKAVPKGTIIMSFKLSIGRTAITSEDLYTNEAIMAFAGFDEKKFNIDFLHFLIANKNWLLGAKQAVKGQTLNKESIGNAKIIIPPIEAQEEFASIYNQADKSEFVGCKSQFIEMFGNPVTNTKGWKTAKIKDVAPEMPSKEQLSGKIWLLNLDMIESNTGRIIEKVYEDVENALSVQSFDEGNVLFSKLRPYLNKVVIPDEPGMATTELVPLRPEPSKLHKVFLSHLLRGNQFVNYANDIAGGTKMPRMPLTELRNFDCILPPMDKQLEFVFIAEQVDKSEFVGCKSQFIEMFKEKGYPLRMLKSFADVSTGGTPSKANLEYWNGDKPWVSAEDMKNKYVYDTCEKVTEAGYATCKIIPVDTLMYVCRGSIGVMAINKIECATNQSICRAKCHDNVCNVEFLYHALMYQKDNIKKMGTGTSFKSLNQTSFSELKIELPPYNEQMKFVSIAQQADKSEFELRKSIDAIDQVIKSLINN